MCLAETPKMLIKGGCPQIAFTCLVFQTQSKFRNADFEEEKLLSIWLRFGIKMLSIEPNLTNKHGWMVWPWTT